jgi:hypothetical protein
MTEHWYSGWYKNYGVWIGTLLVVFVAFYVYTTENQEKPALIENCTIGNMSVTDYVHSRCEQEKAGFNNDSQACYAAVINSLQDMLKYYKEHGIC